MNGAGLRPVAALWEWQESAACRDLSNTLFFSPFRERSAAKREREERAQKVCAGCPVREECARFALEIGEEHGTWGGMTSQERVELLRRPQDASPAQRVRPSAEAAK